MTDTDSRTQAASPARLDSSSDGEGVGNFSMDETSASSYASAAESGGTDAYSSGLEAGVQAAGDGDDVAAAVEAAAADAGAAGPELAACVAILPEVIGAVAGVAGLITFFIELFKTEFIQIIVANNTPLELSFGTAQIYLNHGKTVAYPSGSISAVTSPAVGGTIYGSLFAFQNDAGALLGPSGAVGMSITDPNNPENYLGALCFAFSDPYSGSNSCAVAFDVPSYEDWFNSFNSGPAQLTGFATLPAQTVNGTAYPGLVATCGLNSLTGSNCTVLLNLATVTPCQGYFSHLDAGEATMIKGRPAPTSPRA